MMGQVCRCMACSRPVAVQSAGLVKVLQNYAVNYDEQPTPDGDWSHLTNGAWVMWAPLILCAGCTPEGATVTPLAAIGVRP